MPRMGGKELADALATGVDLLHKPFVSCDLQVEAREILERA